MEWQQKHDENVQVKYEDSISYHFRIQSPQSAMRMRARLRRNHAQQYALCDRNRNNLLMIAPNNHFKPTIMSPSKKVKIEEVDREKEDEKDKGKSKNKD